MTKNSACQSDCACSEGRRCSSRRAAVLKALASAGRHLSAEDLHRRARKLSPGIGMATVYRSVKCLCGCGKVLSVKLGDGTAVYEAASARSGRVRLVCSACGAVSEAAGPGLERQAGTLAGKIGFSLSIIELRGLCAACEKKGRP